MFAGPFPSRCRPSPSVAARLFVFIYVVASAPAVVATPAASEFDDRPRMASQSRSEADRDRIAALAHFAAGRTYQQRGNFDLALRHYARADRLDPAATTARSNLVAFAVEERQFPLAARYALKGIDPGEVGDENLRRLALYLIEQGEVRRAIDLCEKALAVAQERRDSSVGQAANAENASDIFTRLELGRLYYLAEKHREAAEQFARVNEALEHPDRYGITPGARKALLGNDEVECYELFGEAFLLTNRLPEAEAAFRKSHSLTPNEARLKLSLARIAARRGQTPEAMKLLEAALARGVAGEGSAPYQLLAELLKKLGQENSLPDRLQKLHSADPANIPLSYFLAGQYLQSGRTDRAEALYLELAEKSPTMLAYRSLAEIYRKAGRYDRLLALLGKVMAVAGTLEALGPEVKSLTEDAALFEKLVSAGRKKALESAGKLQYGEFYALGMLAQERKQYGAANEFYELALKADPSKAAEVLLAWGIGSLVGERPAEAAKVFQRGVDMKALPEKNPVFYYYLSGALAACDRMEPALAAARVAEQRQGDSARFAGRVPWILFRVKRYEEAQQAYLKFFTRFGGEKDSLETLSALREARLSMSALCVILGRLDEGEEWAEQVLDEYPDDVEANNDLGFLWADENKHLDRALKMIVAAVAAEPDNHAYRDSLGWVLYRLGRYPEAAAELKKAVDEKQPDGTILDHLGDALEKLGRHNEAVAAWRRALAALEKEKDAEKAGKVRGKIRD